MRVPSEERHLLRARVRAACCMGEGEGGPRGRAHLVRVRVRVS